MAASTMSADEARRLCAMAKTAEPAERWLPRREHFGEVQMVFGVVCAPPFPGIHVELRAASGRRVVRRDLDLGLWFLEERVPRRVYQLTITDGGSYLHMEADGTTYSGSHEHIGAQTVALDHLNGASFDDAMEHFCRQTGLHLDGRIDDPFAFTLRG